MVCQGVTFGADVPVLLRVSVPVAPLPSWVGAGLAEVELDADCPPSVDGEEVLRYGCVRLNTAVVRLTLEFWLPCWGCC